jgi:beta-mannosidase
MVVGFIPEKEGQAMWLIDYTVGKEKYTNHYLAGKAPFKLTDYLRWYRKLG